MPSDSSDRRRTTTTTTTKPHHINGCPPPDQPEHLQCPRCDSTNTKFCYYNNYNFSQPRHFCKACRRYWTHGGTLRDIPIGGGSRKNAKRSRLTAPTNVVEYRHMAPPTATPFMFPFVGEHVGGLHNNNIININNNILCYGKQCDSFTSLLNGGNGPGVFGVEDGGFGFGRGVWSLYGGGDGGCYGGGGGGGNMWQMEGGEGLSLPELAISTPGMMI